MKRMKRVFGTGLLGAVLLSALAGFAQPAKADVDVDVYFGPPVFAPPPPWGFYRYEPRPYYYYPDRGYYYPNPGWRHDGHRWRWEQGYWGR